MHTVESSPPQSVIRFCLLPSVLRTCFCVAQGRSVSRFFSGRGIPSEARRRRLWSPTSLASVLRTRDRAPGGGSEAAGLACLPRKCAGDLPPSAALAKRRVWFRGTSQLMQSGPFVGDAACELWQPPLRCVRTPLLSPTGGAAPLGYPLRSPAAFLQAFLQPQCFCGIRPPPPVRL